MRFAADRAIEGIDWGGTAHTPLDLPLARMCYPVMSRMSCIHREPGTGASESQ